MTLRVLKRTSWVFSRMSPNFSFSDVFMVRLGLLVLRHQVVAHGNMVPEELTTGDADLAYVHIRWCREAFPLKVAISLSLPCSLGEGESQEGEGRKSKVRPLEGVNSAII